MAYRPFLSHKRDDAVDLAQLKRELRLRGAGSWQDVDDLRLGQRFIAAFKRAIGRETGGFIWWATRRSLTSGTICKVEIPAALRRQRRFRRRPYPVVPLFVDISPGEDEEAIQRAVGKRRGKAIRDLNGIVRNPNETIGDFAKRAARRYVRDIVRDHQGDALRIAVTGGREPSEEYDLVLDWRGMLDEGGRLLNPAHLPTLVETLADIRNAAQGRDRMPRITVEPHLRLPLAALVGWEWNRVRPVDLRIIQTSTLGSMVIEDLDVDPRPHPEPTEVELAASGSHVVALSVGKNLGQAVTRYATSIEAGAASHLHLAGPLNAAGVCGAAKWVVDRLAVLNSEGTPKHLLLLGPVSLAVRIGASANGTGRTTLPFWDGGHGYGPSIEIGRG